MIIITIRGPVWGLCTSIVHAVVALGVGTTCIEPYDILRRRLAAKGEAGQRTLDDVVAGG